MAIELTTVADDLVVLHDAQGVHRFEGLIPDTDYLFLGVSARTLPRPRGELLATVATVNDLHFGEVECGRVGDREDGPIVRRELGEAPYPEMMNQAAVDEISVLDPDFVIVKGDLSCDGTNDEWAAFDRCYADRFVDRLRVVRGNHDAYKGQVRFSGDEWVKVDGLTIGLLDTVVPTRTTGALRPQQLDEIDAHLASASGRVLLMGHHQQWVPVGEGANRSDDYFGMHPDSSEALDDLCLSHRGVIGYTAGHTHRHRVRTMTRSGVPSVEIGCVKDFPGTWAEYRVYETGVMQVVHRISSPEALEWSNRCRSLYRDFGVDYETYALGGLGERCFVFPDRAA